MGIVFSNKLLFDKFSIFFSFRRCLTEWRKQKYIKKDKSGWKKIKQKNKIVISIKCPYSWFFSAVKKNTKINGIIKYDAKLKNFVKKIPYSLEIFKK